MKQNNKYIMKAYKTENKSAKFYLDFMLRKKVSPSQQQLSNNTNITNVGAKQTPDSLWAAL